MIEANGESNPRAAWVAADVFLTPRDPGFLGFVMIFFEFPKLGVIHMFITQRT
jgi:hypothetical protein